MSKHIVTSTEASRHFSDLLNRVRYQGQSFDIKRGKEVIAKLVPAKPRLLASEFNDFIKSLPPLAPSDDKSFKESITEIQNNFSKLKNLWD